MEHRSINPQLGGYIYPTEKYHDDQPLWLSMPEVPTAAEMGRFQSSEDAKLKVAVPPNQIRSAWRNKNVYLESHYLLLREDAVAPLRAAIDEVRAKPDMLEKESEEHAGLYDNVRMTTDVSIIS